MKVFNTGEGSSLQLISAEAYMSGREARISDTALTPEAIYEARSISYDLSREGYAVSFDTSFEKAETTIELGATSLRLLLLNDDYTPVGHRDIVIQNGYWRIAGGENKGIDIYDRGHEEPLSTLRVGYLLPKPYSNIDETLRRIATTTDTIIYDTLDGRYLRGEG